VVGVGAAGEDFGAEQDVKLRAVHARHDDAEDRGGVAVLANRSLL
jgi:hypothetical protein